MTRYDITLRECTAGDLDAVEAWAPTGNSRTHHARFGRQEAGTSTFFLATLASSGTFAGSCEARWDGCAAPEVPRCPEINGLQVWPEDLQSHGIGRQIIAAVEKEARRRGYRRIGLGVAEPRARALYERLGYVDSGVTYTDRYVLIDEDHREHHMADECRWLMKELAVTGAEGSGIHGRGITGAGIHDH